MAESTVYNNQKCDTNELCAPTRGMQLAMRTIDMVRLKCIACAKPCIPSEITNYNEADFAKMC